ncbi:MAG TPA: ABC transporter substrate-binding protein [Burkholderiales bacterium]|nr:ABC transporter substrate-binding protein [Burkholderiales bacterium]
MKKLSRRDILKAGAGAAATLGLPAIARAQSKEIVILGLWDQTGAFSDVGPLNDRGMKMALEERGMQVLGRPIKYITRDGGTQAGTSTRRTEEAVDGDGAKFVIGPWSSGVALAVSEVAKRKKVLHLFSGGTEDISGARCHRYSFQWAASPYTAAKTVVDSFMKANPKAKRWHLLVADYAFGWSVEKYVREVGKAHGIEFVGADRHPLGEREFSNYVQKAAANKPDAVAMINFGGDAVGGAREMFNFGLTPKIPLIMTWSSGVEEIVQLSPENRENLWVGSNFYYTADTPGAKEFVRNYSAKFGNPPGYAPSAAYSMTRLLLAGFDKAKSAEVQDVVRALEGIEVNDIVGPMKMDAATHQNIRPYFFMRCKTKAAMKGPMDFADIIATGDAPLPREYGACKDIGGF